MTSNDSGLQIEIEETPEAAHGSYRDVSRGAIQAATLRCMEWHLQNEPRHCRPWWRPQ